MLQQEFEARVKMKVSSKEFEAIHEVYLNSDYDKDEFSKLWVKMNNSRVRKFIEDKKEKDKIEELRTKAWNIINSYYVIPMYGKPALSILSKKQSDFCKSIGIIEEGFSSTSIETIICRLREFLDGKCMRFV